MFGIGMPELLLILAIALIVIGPKKLPDLAKSLGRALGEFKKATNELKQSIHLDTGLSDVRKAFNEVHSDVHSTLKDEPSSSTKPASDSISNPAAESKNSAEKPAAESFDNLKAAFDQYNQPAEAAAPGPSSDKQVKATNSDTSQPAPGSPDKPHSAA
jgi:TatA/E family protein of Tat protein translocase